MDIGLVVDHHQAPDRSRSDSGFAFVIQEMQRVSIGMHSNYEWLAVCRLSFQTLCTTHNENVGKQPKQRQNFLKKSCCTFTGLARNPRNYV